jgi:hypothetical protein
MRNGLLEQHFAEQDNLQTSNGQYEYLGINVPSYGLQMKTGFPPTTMIFCNLDATKKR